MSLSAAGVSRNRRGKAGDMRIESRAFSRRQATRSGAGLVAIAGAAGRRRNRPVGASARSCRQAHRTRARGCARSAPVGRHRPVISNRDTMRCVIDVAKAAATTLGIAVSGWQDRAGRLDHRRMPSLRSRPVEKCAQSFSAPDACGVDRITASAPCAGPRGCRRSEQLCLAVASPPEVCLSYGPELRPTCSGSAADIMSTRYCAAQIPLICRSSSRPNSISSSI